MNKESLKSNSNPDFVLNELRSLCNAEKNVFLAPTGPVICEKVALAILLDEYVNWGRDQNRKQYRSFYTNSRYESLHGAIKIARHYKYAKTKQISEVLVLDQDSGLSLDIDPAVFFNEQGLVKDIRYLKIKENFIDILNSDAKNKIAVFAIDTLSVQEINNVLDLCKINNIIAIATLFKHNFSENSDLLRKINILPDIFVFDESLIDNSFPFAAFLISKKIHTPWTSLPLATIHSSTFAGNRLAVSLALKFLKSQFSMYHEKAELEQVLVKISENENSLFNAYSKYINPGLVKFYSILGYDFICETASGSNLNVLFRNGTKSILSDCVTGGGAALRGHSVNDAVPEVIDIYNKRKNYWKDLKNELSDLTELPYCIPSVSGATAVDNAIFLSSLITDNKKVMIFKENYAGKTLVSLLGTEDRKLRSPFVAENDQVIYVDPFENDAQDRIDSILRTHEVGLIWFEIIQGSTVREIPLEIIESICRNREKYNFLIGTDEILMGFYRAGELFNSKRFGLKPDIITISKALSDGLIPIGVTCFSKSIYDKAYQKNKNFLDYMENLYINQIASSNALHCIKKIQEPDFQSERKKVQTIFEEGFKKIEKETPFIKCIRGKGHIYKIKYNNMNILFSFFMCRKLIKKANVFIFMERLSPSLSISSNDAESIIMRIENLMKKEKRFLSIRFFIYVIEVLFRMIWW